MSDDSEWFARRRAEQRRQRALALDEARAAAEARGKEPFDLARLEALLDTSPELGPTPPEAERARVWADKYYLQYPEVMTLEQLAALVREMAPYR